MERFFSINKSLVSFTTFTFKTNATSCKGPMQISTDQSLVSCRTRLSAGGGGGGGGFKVFQGSRLAKNNANAPLPHCMTFPL
jgi:hypothetical protein